MQGLTDQVHADDGVARQPATELEELSAIFDGGELDLRRLDTFPLGLEVMPSGWLQLSEIQILYTIARRVRGPILEIGSWIGRSTNALAAAVRDNPHQPLFDCVDFGITSSQEWEELLKLPFGHSSPDEIVRTIYAPGGSTALLIEGLRGNSLLPFVTSIIRGDATKAPLRPTYELIFCDTLHDEREIWLYAPLLSERLAPGGWLICDDILDAERGGTLLAELVGLGEVTYSHRVAQWTKFAVGRKRSPEA